jgi:hypothetical protein
VIIMTTQTRVLLFLFKRVALARLQAVQAGTVLIDGTAALLEDDVQIAPIMPADPDRVAVYFAPVRSTRRQTTAENVTAVESVILEIRCRVYSPGEDDDDATAVETTLDAVINAVACALMDGQPLGIGNVNISNVTQWPTAVQATPEPGMTGTASIIVSADLVTS